MSRVLFTCCLLFACGGCVDAVAVRDWRLQQRDTTSRDIVLPGHLNDLVVEGTPYALSTRVVLPAAFVGRDLTLSIPAIQGIVDLELDDVRVLEPPDTLPVLYRETGPHIWRIPAEVSADGIVMLRLIVDHQWRMSAWWAAPPRLTRATHEPMTMLAWTFNRLCAAFMCIALLEVGVLHFAVYLTDRRRRPYLWFALQNAWACGYALMVTGALQVPLGAYDGPVTAASVCIALLMTVQFLHAHFKLGPPHWAWPVATAIAVIGCVATPNPLTWQPVWAALVVVMLVAVVVYQLVSCARLALRASPPSGLGFMVAAWASLGFGGGADALAWLGIADPLEGARGACPALVIFALMQALMLSRDHLGALKDGDRLNDELCSKVLALEHGGLQLDRLNAELQRQIVDRSRQLFAALTLVGNGEVQVELNPGDIVQGRYRVVAKIGEGGMGVVHEVRRLNDDARLALKVATRVAGAGLARLAREAELAATLQHENIVRVVDVDVASAGFLFIVMEFVDGHTLAELIKRGLPLAEACTILADTAAGMAALHEASIVHRDLKPANVMVARVEGRLVARLMDFGISGVVGAPADRAPEIDDSSDIGKATKTTLLAAFRPVLGGLTTAELIAQQSAALSEDDQADDDDDDDDENEPAEPVTTVTVRRTRTGSSTSRSVKLTEFGHVIGTPLYMAPERGKIGDDYAPSADVFAFGVVAYEVLTGALPFAESPALLVIAGTPVPAPAPLTTRCPALPGQLAEILDRCLAQDPAVRPTANALALALTARGDLEAV